MLSEKDLHILNEKGISINVVEEQLNRFATGFPFLNLSAAASIEKGIFRVSQIDEVSYLTGWKQYCAQDKRITKFVPASGAASRMFKNLFEFLDASYDEPTSGFEKQFFDNIKKFAFYADLNAMCQKNEGKTIDELLLVKGYKAIVANLLQADGLNYGGLPKGLLKFHSYDGVARTPVEEHLKEGSMYAKNSEDEVNIHFTVSPDHRKLFDALVDEVRDRYATKLNTKYSITFSEQKSKTDTIAADKENNAFRDDSGNLVFRPGGHGALIENLNDLDSDIIFIKNIDNVVPDHMKENEARYKELLAGVLVQVQAKAFRYLELIDSGKYSHDDLLDILQFVQNSLCVKNPDTKFLEDVELVLYLKKKLDRPFRVCGMVKNVGEAGGGPFLAENADETISPQILESSQIDMSDPEKKAMFERGTHFNPVDLVCGVKDYRGNKFDLLQFVDPDTGFISQKSLNGKELQALELPGLWNGAMSDWNTIFVEVPIETFNPVKTVNDLLRKEHQN